MTGRTLSLRVPTGLRRRVSRETWARAVAVALVTGVVTLVAACSDEDTVDTVPPPWPTRTTTPDGPPGPRPAATTSTISPVSPATATSTGTRP